MQVFCYMCQERFPVLQEVESCPQCNQGFVENQPAEPQVRAPNMRVRHFSNNGNIQQVVIQQNSSINLPDILQSIFPSTQSSLLGSMMTSMDDLVSQLVEGHQPRSNPTSSAFLAKLPRLPVKPKQSDSDQGEAANKAIDITVDTDSTVGHALVNNDVEIRSEPKYANCSEGEDCYICQDAYEKAEVVLQLPCGHNFHDDCIMQWLKEHNTCPICRATLPTEEEDSSRQGQPNQQQRSNANQQTTRANQRHGNRQAPGSGPRRASTPPVFPNYLPPHGQSQMTQSLGGNLLASFASSSNQQSNPSDRPLVDVLRSVSNSNYAQTATNMLPRTTNLLRSGLQAQRSVTPTTYPANQENLLSSLNNSSQDALHHQLRPPFGRSRPGSSSRANQRALAASLAETSEQAQQARGFTVETGLPHLHRPGQPAHRVTITTGQERGINQGGDITTPAQSRQPQTSDAPYTLGEQQQIHQLLTSRGRLVQEQQQLQLRNQSLVQEQEELIRHMQQATQEHQELLRQRQIMTEELEQQRLGDSLTLRSLQFVAGNSDLDIDIPVRQRQQHYPQEQDVITISESPVRVPPSRRRQPGSTSYRNSRADVIDLVDDSDDSSVQAVGQPPRQRRRRMQNTGLDSSTSPLNPQSREQRGRGSMNVDGSHGRFGDEVPSTWADLPNSQADDIKAHPLYSIDLTDSDSLEIDDV